MKTEMVFSLALTAASFLLPAWEFVDPQPPRVEEISADSTSADNLEIAVPNPTPLLNFAASELQKYLQAATGRKIPMTAAPSGNRPAIILGDSEPARKAGIDVKKLPDQGFRIKRSGNNIFIAGVDSATDFPARNKWSQWYDRGTISGVYGFLERFAGTRFYFPGEMGTLSPKIQDFRLPCQIDIVDRPDFISRKHSKFTGAWYEGDGKYDGVSGENLQILRSRMETYEIPCNHGLFIWNYYKRFGKSHPEYFALMPDGQRFVSKQLMHNPQFCFSSGLKEEIYKDAKAYLTGCPASERGLKGWDINGAYGNSVFNIMPNDWFYMCRCEKCKKISPVGARDIYNAKDEKALSGINNMIWKLTADIAANLKKEGIKGYITQMSYSPYRRIPDVALPDNILVMVAVQGPWKNGKTTRALQKDDDKLLADWNEKLKKRVWIWTYSYKSSGKKGCSAIPEMCPRAIGNYYRDRKNWIFGAYQAGPSEDSYLFTYLNNYIFGKVSWNNSSDIEKLLEEHHTLMFGKEAAVPMKKFYDKLEDLWINRVVGNFEDTPLGPVVCFPSENDLWKKIYTSEVIAELSAMISEAEKVSSGPEKKRVLFIKKHLFEPIAAGHRKYVDSLDAYAKWKTGVPGTVVLRNCGNDETAVRTEVKISKDGENLRFEYQCTEPEMTKIKSEKRVHDGPVWADSCVELMLSPDPDRKKFFHILVNPSGSSADARCMMAENGRLARDPKWDSGAKIEVGSGRDSWKVAITVSPDRIEAGGKKSIAANFCRTRVLTSMSPMDYEYYQWSPLPGKSYQNLAHFGTIVLEPERETNLLKNGSFTIPKKWIPNQPEFWSAWLSNGSRSGQGVELDKTIFISGGQSLRLSNVEGGRVSVGQIFTGKPDTSYRFSFYIRTKDVKLPPDKSQYGAGAYIHAGGKQYSFPARRLTGTNPWHRYEYTFKTDEKTKIIVGLWNWFGSGDVWFDDIGVEECR